MTTTLSGSGIGARSQCEVELAQHIRVSFEGELVAAAAMEPVAAAHDCGNCASSCGSGGSCGDEGAHHDDHPSATAVTVHRVVGGKLRGISPRGEREHGAEFAVLELASADAAPTAFRAYASAVDLGLWLAKVRERQPQTCAELERQLRAAGVAVGV